MAERFTTIESVDADESVLYDVKRDLMGLAIVYCEVAIGFAALVIMIVFMLPVVFPASEPSELRGHMAIFIGLATVVTWLALMVFTYIYRQSKLIITNENLTQVIQHGLFSRSVAELSLADVEDVAADQHGVLASIFDYGSLRVETAGATDNFEFKFCPRPNFYGKVVLDARQSYLIKSKNQTVQLPPQQNDN